jgi:hypothetical protein
MARRRDAARRPVHQGRQVRQFAWQCLLWLGICNNPLLWPVVSADNLLQAADWGDGHPQDCRLSPVERKEWKRLVASFSPSVSPELWSLRCESEARLVAAIANLRHDGSRADTEKAAHP